MITVFGEGRGFRVVWLLEEMGLPYRLRRVDLLAGVENDLDFLVINPAGFIPAIRDDEDGDVTMVESIAIMQYLIARHEPTTYALRMAQKGGGYVFGAVELAYLTRISERDGYKRALETCHDTRNWWASVPSAG